MPIANAPELAPVFPIIARFLSQDDHARCLRVCSLWYHALLPSLWSNLELQDEEFGVLPSIHAIHHHRHLVHRLSLYYNVPPDYYVIHYPNLKVLDIHEPQHFSPTVLAQHTSLQELLLQGDQGLQPNFWETVCRLKHLTLLSLMNMELQQDVMADFYKACESVTSLQLCSVQLASPPPKDSDLGRLNKMEMEGIDGITNEDQLDWLARATNITRLNWSSWSQHDDRTPINTLATYAASRVWWNVQELVLHLSHASDEQISHIIGAMVSARVIHVTETAFGPLSFDKLQSHFATLKELNITHCLSKPGEFIPRILASCPHLEVIAADRVLATHIMEGPPWACAPKLKKLRMFFALSEDPLDAMQQQEDIFIRLSELGCLEYLNVSNWPGRDGFSALDFRLEKGLARLQTLKRLVEFRFYHTIQSMGIEEVEWMLYHWKRLTYMTTTLCQHHEGNDRLVSRLREGGLRS